MLVAAIITIVIVVPLLSVNGAQKTTVVMSPIVLVLVLALALPPLA